MCEAVHMVKRDHQHGFTLTFCPGVRGMNPGVDSASRFCCCTALPISATKCVLRWRRSNVLLAGIDSSVANSSAPKRGSSTCQHNIVRRPKTSVHSSVHRFQIFKIDERHCLWLLERSCIQYRQPAPPNPHGSRGGQLSIIRWHLNLPLNLPLTLALTLN